MTLLSLSKKEVHQKGFTLVELVLTIGLIGILSAIGISIFSSSVEESRYDNTVEEMRQIHHALVGNPEEKKAGIRSSFGYLGDMGAIPNTSSGLSALVTKPGSAANWTINNGARFASGWNGPYISSTIDTQNPLKDAWGRDYRYVTGNNASITSYGADGSPGGIGYDQDIVISIPSTAREATVYGFLSNGGSPYTGTAQVEINYPNGNGAISSSTKNITNGSQGQFQFNNIPMGNRSITFYIPNKSSPTQTIGPIPITIDEPNYLVPTNISDINPGGSGNTGDSGNDTGNTSCSSPSNAISVAPSFIKYSISSQIYFTIAVNSNVTITKITANTGAGATLSEARINGVRYRCNSSRTLSPCPVSEGVAATLSPSYDLSSGNKSVILRFGSSVDSVSSMTLEFTYPSGCDILNVSGLF